ncbi:hypothetical protein ACFQZ4_18700 [Catellatospora coxensis]
MGRARAERCGRDRLRRAPQPAPPPRPWYLLSGALVLFAVGDFFSAVLNSNYMAPYDVPLIIDLIYLVMFVVMSMGLMGLARSGWAMRDRAGVLDAVTLILGLGLLAWMFIIEPRFRTPGLTALDQVAAVAYPLADLLLLAMVVRIVLVARWSAPVALLAVGGLGMFVSDNLHLFARLDGFWHIGGSLDIGWMLLYWGWGLAALLPSMVWLTEPRPAPTAELSGRRVVVLGLSSFIPPMVLLFQALRGPVRNAEGIALLCIAMFVLVLIRLLDAMRIHRQALARERLLREAGVSMVAATDIAQVSDVVRDTATNLMPSHAEHRVILAVEENEQAPVGEPPRDGPGRRCCAAPASCPGARRRAGGLRHRAELPARAGRRHLGRAQHRHAADRGRGGRAADAAGHDGGARPAGGAGAVPDHAERRGQPARQRGVLPGAGAQHRRRDHDRGR